MESHWHRECTVFWVLPVQFNAQYVALPKAFEFGEIPIKSRARTRSPNRLTLQRCFDVGVWIQRGFGYQSREILPHGLYVYKF